MTYKPIETGCSYTEINTTHTNIEDIIRSFCPKPITLNFSTSNYYTAIQEMIDHIYADVHKGVLVIKWTDGIRTKVALEDGADDWDLEAGVNAAIVKRFYKSHHYFQKFITENTTYITPKKLIKSKKKNG